MTDTERAIANAITPLNNKIRNLEQKISEMEKQLKVHAKAFSDLVKSLNPRYR